MSREQQLFEVAETFTVIQVSKRLSDAVKRTFPAEIWVQGQIRNLSRSGRGHVYFDLVDPVAAGAQPKASIAVTLFDSNRQIVNRIITRTGNSVRIDDGVEVRIRAGVEMYTPRGQLQLNMTSIDPEFTLGRLGADRDALLRELTADGLIDANGELPVPLVPLRVALITSGGSAAHADFAKQLEASGYAFEIDLHTTRVQGEFAPEEIAAMLIEAGESPADVIAIVRGGGARTDLAAFDTAPIARAIANSPKPVLCGIGHEIDSSVADLVANRSFKTPTACAQFLVECVVSFDFHLAERAELIVQRALTAPVLESARLEARVATVDERVTRSLVRAQTMTASTASTVERRSVRLTARAEQHVERSQQRLLALVPAALAASQRVCERHIERLMTQPNRVLSENGRELDLREAKLSAVDPVQALRRGYSITTTADGVLVRGASDVAPGAQLITRLADGTVPSTVDPAGPTLTSTQDPQ